MTEEALLAILTRYQVRNHFKATLKLKKTVYAVWANGEQVTKFGTHREAQNDRNRLIVEDIMKLAGRS